MSRFNSNQPSGDQASRSLSQWVDYIQTLHPREMDLSLDRVKRVYKRLYPQGIDYRVLTIGGTNGKGSTAELLSSLLRSVGVNEGKFTSPHLIRFNERFCINGVQAEDKCIVESLERIEQARGDITITYFEFCTLIAIDVFSRAGVEVAVMEVGLGGRLDATNILDADVALITNISFDHTQWLGDSLDKIGFEKAGIVRQESPVLIGMPQPPEGLLSQCEKVGARTQLLNKEFRILQDETDSWVFQNQQGEIHNLPLPFAQRGEQLINACLAIQALTELQTICNISFDSAAIREGIANARLAARCQIISSNPLIMLDVSHNEDSVARLKSSLLTQMRNQAGRLVAVCGMLRDKNILASLMPMLEIVNEWHFVTLSGERGNSSYALRDLLEPEILRSVNHNAKLYCHESPATGYQVALNSLTERDCLVVFGSFYLVGDILTLFENEH